ncbi:MAG: SDR family NAD(P)-dependent oxidoreductase [Pseudomonadota bacterium]
MSQKTILITGCSTGIGHHCALGMRDRGWRVFATARTPEDISKLEGESLEALHLDYADAQSIEACANAVLEKTDRDLFALFNNGAYGQGGAVEDLPTDVLRQQFEANFFGWHDLTTRLLPHMIERRSGRIVQNSSVLGLVALKFRGAYNASKFALEGLTNTMRLELADTGVAVSSIEPGPITSRFGHNADRIFKETIDIENSRFSGRYKRSLENGPDAPGPNDRWRLGPDAVFKKLIHAVESSNPKPHYFVTTPTYLMDVARRTLPPRILDRLLDSVS